MLQIAKSEVANTGTRCQQRKLLVFPGNAAKRHIPNVTIDVQIPNNDYVDWSELYGLYYELVWGRK